MQPDEWEHIMPMAERMRRRAAFDPVRRANDAAALRALMNALGAPAFCRRARCRRAKHCRTARIDCAFITLPFLREEIFPKIFEEAARRGMLETKSGEGFAEAAREKTARPKLVRH